MVTLIHMRSVNPNYPVLINMIFLLIQMNSLLKLKFPMFQVQPYVDWFKWDDSNHPLSNAPEPKRRFIPSKSESKLVRHV